MTGRQGETPAAQLHWRCGDLNTLRNAFYAKPEGLRSALGLAVSILLCFSAAAIGSLSLPGEWYAALRKPSWNPPAWVFGPVWTALYASMGVAAWLVWRRGGLHLQRKPLIAFLIQLALNALWSPVFFGLHLIGVAFIVIIALWLAIAITIAWFHAVSKTAAVLFVPYFLWVSFALVLNCALWQLNR
jgi:translocator protein